MNKRYAQIKDGVVKNVVVVDDANVEFLATLTAQCDHLLDVNAVRVGIGWLFDGQNFTSPPSAPVAEE